MDGRQRQTRCLSTLATAGEMAGGHFRACFATLPVWVLLPPLMCSAGKHYAWQPMPLHSVLPCPACQAMQGTLYILYPGSIICWPVLK